MQPIRPIFTTLSHEETLLTFQGQLNTSVIQELISTLENSLKTFTTRTVGRKVLSVFIEAVQNVFHHADAVYNEGISVMVLKTTHAFLIQTGNYIARPHVEKLKQRIDYINNLNQIQLKHFYKENLKNGLFSKKGTAGLGMIDMVRKSGNTMNYQFENKDNHCAFFSLQLIIKNDDDEQFNH
jgi:hypothetical protein